MYLFRTQNWIVGDQGSLLDENKNDIQTENVTNRKKWLWRVLQKERSKHIPKLPCGATLREACCKVTRGHLVNGWGPTFSMKSWGYITSIHSWYGDKIKELFKEWRNQLRFFWDLFSVVISACFTIKKTVVASTVKRKSPPLLEKERGKKLLRKPTVLKSGLNLLFTRVTLWGEAWSPTTVGPDLSSVSQYSN